MQWFVVFFSYFEMEQYIAEKEEENYRKEEEKIRSQVLLTLSYMNTPIYKILGLVLEKKKLCVEVYWFVHSK